MDKIFHYLKKFSLKHALFERDSNVIVSLSSGADSVFLLYFLSWLKKRGDIKELRAVHFNHQTRPGENELEALFAIEHAKRLGIPIRIVELNFYPTSSNFEARARNLRYRYLKEFSSHWDALIALGHHLDDSLEWSLMQQFKVRSLKKTIGIPLKRSNIRRPLLALSKAQIVRSLNSNKIPFNTDSSNSRDVYERNWIRHHITGPLLARYPSLYKNYIAQAEEKVQLCKKEKEGPFEPFFNGFLLDKSAHRISRQFLIKAVEKLSNKKRGKIADRIEQLREGSKKGKMGPYQFSGGVQVIALRDLTLIINQESLLLMNEYQEQMLHRLIDADIPEPFLLNIKGIKILVSSKKNPNTPFFSLFLHNLVSFFRNRGLTLLLLNSSLGAKELSKNGGIIEKLPVVSP